MDLTQIDRLVFLVFGRNYGTEALMNSLLEHFCTTLARLVPADASLILACSGGPDSQVMLDLVGELLANGAKYTVRAVGVDHGLRSEAQAELNLARDLAHQHNIEFHRLSVELAPTGNTLQNARDARYAAIRAFSEQFECPQFILTAHSATDQCETMVQRFTRGTGLRGASAIHESRNGLVRPLLAHTRHEIVNYAKSNGISFAQDPSNQNRTRSRTQIRQDIIPVLDQLNPEAQRHWAKFAEHSMRATQFLDAHAKPLLSEATGPLGSLKVHPLLTLESYLRQWVIGLWLAEHNLPVDTRYIEEIERLAGTPNKKLSVGGKLVINEAGSLWAPLEATQFEENLVLGEKLPIPALGGYLKSSIIKEKKSPFSPLKSPRQVAFDADRLHLGLKVRPWRLGDKFRPFGLQGSVKIGDLFTNLKIPTPLREHWPLVMDGDVIIWVVGLRRGSLAPMSNKTANVLYMEYTGDMIPSGISNSMEPAKH